MSRRQTPPRVCRAPPRASRCLSVCLGAGPGPRRRVGTHAEARRKLVLIFGDPRDRVGHQMTAQVNGERFKRKRILHRRETRFEARERSPVEKNRNAKKSSLALGRPRPFSFRSASDRRVVVDDVVSRLYILIDARHQSLRAPFFFRAPPSRFALFVVSLLSSSRRSPPRAGRGSR
jgi:hypothetical protein